MRFIILAIFWLTTTYNLHNLHQLLLVLGISYEVSHTQIVHIQIARIQIFHIQTVRIQTVRIQTFHIRKLQFLFILILLLATRNLELLGQIE